MFSRGTSMIPRHSVPGGVCLKAWVETVFCYYLITNIVMMVFKLNEGIKVLAIFMFSMISCRKIFSNTCAKSVMVKTCFQNSNSLSGTHGNPLSE